MKKLNKIVCVALSFLLLATLVGVSVVWVLNSSVNDVALSFLENVLPFDCKQYDIKLESASPSNGEHKILTYFLESKDSTIHIIFTIQNDNVAMVYSNVNRGSAICDETYNSSLIEAAKSLLQKYQIYTSRDSSKFIEVLSEINSVENSTTTKGDIKLVVVHDNLTGTVFGDLVNFSWMQTVNGCDYSFFSISFKDGVFHALTDNRVMYTLGDTSVNVSKEEAVAIALDAIKSYSYSMADDWLVSDFVVRDDKIEAVLYPQTKENNVWYPAWSVILPLDGVYPGSVRELLVGIWAGTGEVYLVHHQAYSGFP